MCIRQERKNKLGLLLKKSKFGKGIFAEKDYKAGDFLIEFKGQIIKRDKMPIEYESLDDHFVQIGKDYYMGPSGELDDFINHSCNPNSGLVVRGKKAKLIAIKDVQKGEEIVWDYSTTMSEDDWELKCKCGAKNCRKIIQDYKHLPSDVRSRYEKMGIVPYYALISAR